MTPKPTRTSGNTKPQRNQQQIPVLCQNCQQMGIRTMLPGGTPRYCDACKDAKARSRSRKRQQRQREQERQQQAGAIAPLVMAQDPLDPIAALAEAIVVVIPPESCDIALEATAVPEVQVVEASSLDESCDTSAEAPVPVLSVPKIHPIGARTSSPIPVFTPDPTMPLPPKLSASAYDAFEQSLHRQEVRFVYQVYDAWFKLVPRCLGKEGVDQECWGQPVPCADLADDLGIPLPQVIHSLSHCQCAYFLECFPQAQAFTVQDPMEKYRVPVVPMAASTDVAITVITTLDLP